MFKIICFFRVHKSTKKAGDCANCTATCKEECEDFLPYEQYYAPSQSQE